MQYLNIYSLIFRKLFTAFSTTIVQMSVMKHINETVPVAALAKFAIAMQLVSTIGTAFCFGLGRGLPQGDYDPAVKGSQSNTCAYIADKNDNFWRLIYFFPIISNTLMLFVFVFFINAESIMFSLRQQNDNEAMILIKKVYHSSEDHQEIMETLKS